MTFRRRGGGAAGDCISQLPVQLDVATDYVLTNGMWNGGVMSSHVDGSLCFAFPSAARDTTVLDAGLALAVGSDEDVLFRKGLGFLMTLQDSAITKPWVALLSL